ncbi:MFS transporter [Pandoraea apista]|uniref:Transporter n=1 Tax=Pandoraea apista TaxID=93218 RepID=A0A0G4JEW9_9BURK|nr:MFS transporter [Pandoraea apista]ALS66067.1 MFS transporter [Pandoraea apista]AVF39063.1 MFS transporter [Pandoraea apista]OXS95392.1 MFS transporter [Pandoraea apista]PTE02395.1 MFS transporter [Pandoraea apista]RRJ33324.1 MFS transporter [Pandoraea apista]
MSQQYETAPAGAGATSGHAGGSEVHQHDANAAAKAATPGASANYGRVVAASCFGTAIEWYDFFIYGFLAPIVFDRLFFPQLDPMAGMIAVFATFAVGFIARPIGGIVFGHFGDRIGRKSILLFTLILMGVATTMIGLLPTYDRVGMWAPVMLVTLRFVQGFALGGESVGGLLMTVEGAPAHLRGLFGGLIQAAGPTSIVGASLAIVLITRLPEDDLLTWGWRLPFLVSLLLVALGTYVRLKVEESPSFKAAEQHRDIAKVPVAEVITHYWRPTLVTFFICLAETSFFYLVAIFSLSYGTKTLGLPRNTMADGVLYANILAMLTIPAFGMLSDKLGRRPMFLMGLAATAIFIYPFFLMMGSKETALVVMAIVIGAGVIHPMMFGPEGSFFSELFDTRVRFSGVSLGKQIGTVLGGGLAPMIAASLLAWSHGQIWPVIVYFLILAAMALISTFLVRETKDRTL